MVNWEFANLPFILVNHLKYLIIIFQRVESYDNFSIRFGKGNFYLPLFVPKVSDFKQFPVFSVVVTIDDGDFLSKEIFTCQTYICTSVNTEL